MTCGKDSVIITDDTSFEDMLDTACGRLRETHIHYTLRRIKEMDEELAVLEHELDEFIGTNIRQASGSCHSVP